METACILNDSSRRLTTPSEQHFSRPAIDKKIFFTSLSVYLDSRNNTSIFDLTMQIIITISKAEFEGKEALEEKFLQLSGEIGEIGDVYTIAPQSGTLYHFLNFLRDNKINYGTHFNRSEANS